MRAQASMKNLATEGTSPPEWKFLENGTSPSKWLCCHPHLLRAHRSFQHHEYLNLPVEVQKFTGLQGSSGPSMGSFRQAEAE